MMTNGVDYGPCFCNNDRTTGGHWHNVSTTMSDLYQINLCRDDIRDIAASAGVSLATMFWILDGLRESVVPVVPYKHGNTGRHAVPNVIRASNPIGWEWCAGNGDNDRCEYRSPEESIQCRFQKGHDGAHQAVRGPYSTASWSDHSGAGNGDNE